MIRKKDWRNFIISKLFFFTRVQIFRVHNVEEVKQGLLVFENLLNK